MAHKCQPSPNSHHTFSSIRLAPHFFPNSHHTSFPHFFSKRSVEKKCGVNWRNEKVSCEFGKKSVVRIGWKKKCGVNWAKVGTCGPRYIHPILVYTVSKKTVQNYFCQNSELCQISTNCENFWHKDGKDDKLMCGVLTFHLT